MIQLYESYNDAFSLLPVKIYRHNLYGNYIYAPLHWHRSLEITVTLEGSIRFNTGSNNFDFGESSWIFVNSGELHSCRYITPSDHFTGISIIISLPFIEKWLGKNICFYNPEEPKVTMQMKRFAKELYDAPPTDDEHSLLLMSKLFEILYLISTHCMKPGAPKSSVDKSSDIATELTQYIEQHYQENLSLESIAQNFTYSASYFSRMFKQVLGVNFHSYLNFVRVCHAAEQMSAGYENITACAYENGFPNVKSFIHTFKKLYGCTPGAFISSLKK